MMVYMSDFWMFLQSMRIILNCMNINSMPIAYLVLILQLFQYALIIANNRYRITPRFFILILLVPLYLYNSLTLNLIYIVLSVLILQKQSLKQVIRHFFIIQMTILIFQTGLLKIGILHDSVWPMLKGSAHTMGFANPNTTAGFYQTVILISSLMIVATGRKAILNIFLLLGAYIAYKTTYGRTYFISSLFYFFLLLLLSLPHFVKCTRAAYITVPFLFYALMYILTKLYETEPWLDIVFTKRLSINHEYFSMMRPINLFIGMPLLDGPLDTAYLLMILCGGIVSVYFFLSMYVRGIKRAPVDYLKKYFPYCFAILMAGFSESGFASFTISTVLFFRILAEYADAKKRGKKVNKGAVLCLKLQEREAI